MISYKPGDAVGVLEDWPFENPASEYVIRNGSPAAAGRIDAGGPGCTTRAGIWRCTAGTFECTEQGDELMTILEGRCRVTDHDSGVVADLSPGDSLFVRDGARVTWEIPEEVVKVFFGQKADGY